MEIYKIDEINSKDLFSNFKNTNKIADLNQLDEICIQLNTQIESQEYILDRLKLIHDFINESKKLNSLDGVLCVLLKYKFPDLLLFLIQHENTKIQSYSLFMLYYSFLTLKEIVPYFPHDPTLPVVYSILETIQFQLDNNHHIKYFFYSLTCYRILFEMHFAENPDAFNIQVPVLVFLDQKEKEFYELIKNPEFNADGYEKLIICIFKQFLLIYEILSKHDISPDDTNTLFSFILEVFSDPLFEDLYYLALHILINLLQNKSIPVEKFSEPRIMYYLISDLHAIDDETRKSAFELFSNLFTSGFPIAILAQMTENDLYLSNSEVQANPIIDTETHSEQPVQQPLSGMHIESNDDMEIEQDGFIDLLRSREDKSVLASLIDDAMDPIDDFLETFKIDLTHLLNPQIEEKKKDPQKYAIMAKEALTMIKNGILNDTEDHLFARLIIENQKNSFPFISIVDCVCNNSYFAVSEAASYCLLALLSAAPRDEFLKMNEVVYQSKDRPQKDTLYRSFVCAFLKMASIDDSNLIMNSLNFLYDLTIANQFNLLMQNLQSDYFTCEGYSKLEDIMEQNEEPEICEICHKIREIYNPQEE